jgi:hypothetical protein
LDVSFQKNGRAGRPWVLTEVVIPQGRKPGVDAATGLLHTFKLRPIAEITCKVLENIWTSVLKELGQNVGRGELDKNFAQGDFAR